MQINKNPIKNKNYIKEYVNKQTLYNYTNAAYDEYC